MRPSLVAAFTAVLLALPLAPSAVADEGADKADPSVPSQDAQAQAEEALDQAEALLSDDSGGGSEKQPGQLDSAGDATMALLQLMRVRDDLSSPDRKRATRLFARPTDDVDDPNGNSYEVPEETPVCGPHVCVHWVASTGDKPKDLDGDGQLRDTVRRVVQVAEHVHTTYRRAGYRHPDFDGTTGNHGDTAQNDKFDIYLKDLGPGLYGYTAPEPWDDVDPPYDRQGYLALHSNFHGFPRTYLTNAKVTLAHEYFHAEQFAYDALEDPWFMEATATWAEDELYDGINDNRQYLPAGQLVRTGLPLDEFEDDSSAPYGQWIFFRYLTERWSRPNGSLPKIMLQMIRRISGRAGAPDDYSTRAIQRVLSWRHTSFTRVYGQFAMANRTPTRTYEEGRHYPRSRPNRRFNLAKGHRGTGARHATLEHQTSYVVRLRPRRNLRQRDWTVRVAVDMPRGRTAPVAKLVIRRKSGGVIHRNFRLGRKGDGKRAVAFSSRKVRYVELVLVNASRRTYCPSKPNAVPGSSYYACYGSPKDDVGGTKYAARIFRR